MCNVSLAFFQSLHGATASFTSSVCPSPVPSPDSQVLHTKQTLLIRNTMNLNVFYANLNKKTFIVPKCLKKISKTRGSPLSSLCSEREI